VQLLGAGAVFSALALSLWPTLGHVPGDFETGLPLAIAGLVISVTRSA
jgi:hypothetical protein